MSNFHDAEQECAEFNAKYPVHTAVILTRDTGEKFYTRTRSKAEVTQNGNAVIFLEGIAGYYLLDRVQALAGLAKMLGK